MTSLNRLIILIIGFVIGWLFGSLLNYVADELPLKRRLGKPACPACQAEYPILNYLFWPRRCPVCGAKRGLRSWVLEFGLGVAGALLVDFSPPGLRWVVALILLGYLALVTVIDIEHRLILHVTSLAGALIALGIGIHLHGIVPTLVGGAVGFGAMLLFYLFGILFLRLSVRLRGEQITEQEAIGFGDVNLSGVVGLLLGWPGITLGLLLTILIAGLISLAYLVLNILRRQYHPALAVPYGPFLTLSAFLLIYIRPLFFK